MRHPWIHPCVCACHCNAKAARGCGCGVFQQGFPLVLISRHAISREPSKSLSPHTAGTCTGCMCVHLRRENRRGARRAGEIFKVKLPCWQRKRSSEWQGACLRGWKTHRSCDFLRRAAEDAEIHQQNPYLDVFAARNFHNDRRAPVLSGFLHQLPGFF